MTRKIKYLPKYDLAFLQNNKKRKLKLNFAWYTLISTWFYSGAIPIVPGTIGSLAVFPVYFIIIKLCPDIPSINIAFWMILTALMIIGYFAVKKFQNHNNVHDHSSIVIDEVLGMLLAFSLCFKQSYLLSKKLYPFINIKPLYLSFFIVFIIFRYFDIAKPFFIRFIDKHMNNSLGVILDDLLAGFYTALIVIATYNILNKFI